MGQGLRPHDFFISWPRVFISHASKSPNKEDALFSHVQISYMRGRMIFGRERKYAASRARPGLRTLGIRKSDYIEFPITYRLPGIQYPESWTQEPVSWDGQNMLWLYVLTGCILRAYGNF